jgi:DNA-binding transcriptional ArsR family regulator
MSEENDEMNKLRDEVAELREQLISIADRLEKSAEIQKESTDSVKVETKQEEKAQEPESESFEEEEKTWDDRHKRYDSFHHSRGGLASDWGDKLGDYISDMVDSVMENVTTELERNLYTGTRSPKNKPTVMTDMEVERTVRVMSALGNEHRIKIMEELSWGGAYASDLQEALDEISPSTLNSHLDVLQEAGMVIQERKRGRYLITMAGRIAIQMAAQLSKRANVVH